MSTPAEAAREIARLQNRKSAIASEALAQSKVTLDIGGIGKNTKFELESVSGWTVDSFRAMSLQFMETLARDQAKRGNYLEHIWVDGSPFKDPLKFNRSITLLWPGGNDIRPVMNRLWAEVNSRIGGVKWAWRVRSRDGQRQRQIEQAIRSGGPVQINFGDTVYYVPVRFTGNPDATYQNILYLGRQGKNALGHKRRKSKKGKTYAKGKKGGKGFYALSASTVRRYARSQGAYVRAIHSLKYARGIGRVLPPGKKIGDRTQSGGIYQGSWGFAIRLQIGGRGRR